MRLIDADKLLTTIEPLEASGGHKQYQTGVNWCLKDIFPKIINEEPTVNAIIPVYCKDCKWYTTELDEEDIQRNFLEYQGLCNNIDKYMNDDDYCSYGEKVNTNA